MATSIYAGNPPPNVVKWIEENVKSAGWADFDISKLGSPVAEKALYETTVSTTSPVAMRNIQVLDDNSLVFKNLTGSSANSCAIHWAFESGHEFEAEHFKASPESRSAKSPEWLQNVSFVMFTLDGTEVITRLNGTSLRKYSVGTPFDFTTVNTTTPIQETEWKWNNCNRIYISPDGKHLFCDDGYCYIYQYDLETPWDLTSICNRQDFDIKTLTESKFDNWLYWISSSTFDPSGKAVLIAGQNGTANIGLGKIALDTPFDLGSINLDKSSFTYVTPARSGYRANAIAVNNAGTKLLICESDQNWTNNGLFREFDLAK